MASMLRHTSLIPREFTLHYLGQITDNFSEDNIIGRGEHGVVYKGVLNSGEEITLKKLYHMPELDDTIFRNELNNLVRARHQNIVRLVGYCCNLENKRVEHDGKYTSAVVEERFLCFEYLQGGSLDKYILDESCALDWHTCFKIIKGICEGLNYLHNGTDEHILHLNLKPSNILLDKNMMPKIGDFGLSRLFPSAQSYVTAQAMERTWKPLEYIDKGQTTSKFDIFSLGLIIIQLMSRFIGYSRHPDMPSQQFFDLVRLNWEKQLATMTPCDTSWQVRACIEIALRCLEDDQMKRPAIADIVNELNEINTIESSFRGKVEMEDRGSEWLRAAMELPVSASLGPIGPLFQKLHSFKATKESLPAGINQGDIQSLKKELEKLCISLMDLLEANDTSFTAMYWMKEVREVCYDTENYFDKLIMQSRNGSSVRWICKLLKTRPQIAIDFSTLVARVADARERRGRFLEWNIDKQNVDHECGKASTTPDIASSSRLPLQLPVPVAGVRRSELTLRLSVPAVALIDDLVNLLAFNDEKQKQLKVVPIFGFAGAGKTTVARILYRNFGGKFDCRAFLRMSRQPDIKRLLTSMLSQIKAPPAHAFADVQVLVASIRKHLEHKRYFVIIDELWTPSVWNSIRRAFPDGNCRSRVITTTQIEDAALACCSYQSKYIFKMRLFTDYQSRELFSTGVSNSGCASPQDFKELSYGVITTSGGLPLATVNIGSISEPNLISEQWEQIKYSVESTLIANPTCEVMEEVLNLIYNSLPRHLKTCLLYFNMYPEGYTVWKDVLVGQWISEDFIRVTRKKQGFMGPLKQQDTEKDEVEEKVRVAQGYFAELVGRGLIQAVDTDDKGAVLSCTVHHMVLDLIRCKSMEQNFITTVDKFPSTLVLPDMVRRLSVQFGDAKVANIPENMVSSQVRSLLYFGSFECAPSAGDYGFLRVLNLYIWADQDKTFDLTTISELFQLKYFKVECNITVNLPAKVKMLQNMETLQVDAPLSVVPPDIFALKSLLHLCLPSQVNLPDGIVHMTSLRSLGDFSLSTNSADNVLGLGKLIKLWDLRVTCSAVKPDDLVGNMKHFGSIFGEFKELKSLIMDSGTSNLTISCDSLSNVSCAPALLERFEFPRTCIFPSLPKWFGDLQKLCILKVSVREILMENIDILKGLHVLTTLSICVFVTPKERIVLGEEGFTLLRTFKFTSAALCLAFTVGAMPKVERLKLRFDANKSEQHDLRHAGIDNLLGLKEISAKIGISGADEMKSEAALLIDILRTHPSSPIFNVHSVDRNFDEQITVGYEEEHQTTETQDLCVNTMCFDSRSFVTPDTSAPMQNLEDEDKATHTESALEATFSQLPKDHLITSEILEEGFHDQRGIREKYPREDDNTEAHSWTSPPPSSIVTHPQDTGEDEDKVTHTESALETTFSKLPRDHLITSDISEEGFNDQRGIREKGPREYDNIEAHSWTSPPPGSIIAHPQDSEFEHISTEEKESKKDEIGLEITMEDATGYNELPSSHGPAQTNQMARSKSNKGSDSMLYELKEQLLLLATLVATVTYLSGLNLPGGDWQQQWDGHLAGDQILRDTYYSRYLVFSYCNATAFTSSVMVCLILVMPRRNSTVWMMLLRSGMGIELLAVMGSYFAGACRDTFTTIWAACAVSAYIACAFILCYLIRRDNTTVDINTNMGYQKREKIEVLMLLATFTFTISYAAALNPPGGFGNSTRHQNDYDRLIQLAGKPIMQFSRPRRYRAFFLCNTVAVVASLLVILLLLVNKVSRRISATFVAVYGLIAVALLGLMGAYAAGSSREVKNTVMVIISQSSAIASCVGLQLALNYVFHWKPIENMRDTFSQWSKKSSPAGDRSPVLKNYCYLAMVLASFTVCITYQAGLDPPGGLWQDNLHGHEIGHPVLRTTRPTRYQVFFYSNSAAFVTSLVLVMMVQSKFLLTLHTLEGCMVLDLICLVTAYAAGSTRDAKTSIYVVIMIVVFFIYIPVHVLAVEMKEKMAAKHVLVPAATRFAPAATRQVGGGRSKETLEDNGQVLLLIAIIAVALTYQAGLNPPGGFWPADDEQVGHSAGYPVLMDNYPGRYKAFFYCNAVSFMASVAVIIFFVNQKLYRQGIRCYVLHACMALAMIALMGAYASGSSRQLSMTTYFLTLVTATVLLQGSILWYKNRFVRYMTNHQVEPETRRRRRREWPVKEQELEYLMLLGVLAASVTYRSGLRPPGDVWQENGAAYSAGDPVLFDINKRRYDIFFYSNSASFMASVAAIVMLLPLTLSNLEWLRYCLPFHTGNIEWVLWPVRTALLLDMLGLLVAYVAGSTRNWEGSRNVMIFMIGVPVLIYISAYAVAIFSRCRRVPTQSGTQADQQMLPEV